MRKGGGSLYFLPLLLEHDYWKHFVLWCWFWCCVCFLSRFCCLSVFFFTCSKQTYQTNSTKQTVKTFFLHKTTFSQRADSAETTAEHSAHTSECTSRSTKKNTQTCSTRSLTGLHGYITLVFRNDSTRLNHKLLPSQAWAAHGVTVISAPLIKAPEHWFRCWLLKTFRGVYLYESYLCQTKKNPNNYIFQT